MCQADLVSDSHRHGGPATTRRDKDARTAPDLVDRNFGVGDDKTSEGTHS